MTDQKTALRILEALRKGPVGDSGVLVELGFDRLSTLLERLRD